MKMKKENETSDCEYEYRNCFFRWADNIIETRYLIDKKKFSQPNYSMNWRIKGHDEYYEDDLENCCKFNDKDNKDCICQDCSFEYLLKLFGYYDY